MTQIYPEYTYGPGPRDGCWWDQTVMPTDRAALQGTQHCDVAIIGGGFTGVSAALHLARAGVGVVVLERQSVGWGASGRNGGFCCLGGARASDAQLRRRFGTDALAEWYRAELAAINLVEKLIETHGIEVDRHSRGETLLAHRARDMANLRKKAADLREHRGIGATIIEKHDLVAQGMNGPFHGAMTTDAGFALNPRKYLDGLAGAAEAAGARIFHNTTVTRMERHMPGHRLISDGGTVLAKKVIVATNGYSSETVPHWLADRYMPTQSSVLVTRPLKDTELEAQGWTTGQMAYDSRHLLHYFRLMPDRRFLFGMRGGLLSSAISEADSRRRVRQDFEKMFPAWRSVDSPFQWSGLVCLARQGAPHVGPIPGQEGVFVGLCYHGNGVAMASYAGALLADLVQGSKPIDRIPAVMQAPLTRFGLGRARRLAMLPAYAGYGVSDRLP